MNQVLRLTSWSPYKCDLYIGRPAECEDHNISGVGGYWIFGIIHPSLEKTRSTHIARKLDGEGGSPRYMAPECAWDHNFREGVMSSWWMDEWKDSLGLLLVSSTMLPLSEFRRSVCPNILTQYSTSFTQDCLTNHFRNLVKVTSTEHSSKAGRLFPLQLHNLWAWLDLYVCRNTSMVHRCRTLSKHCLRWSSCHLLSNFQAMMPVWASWRWDVGRRHRGHMDFAMMVVILVVIVIQIINMLKILR